MDGLLSVSSARQQLLDAFQPVGNENVTLAQAADRVLAKEVAAGMDLPIFTNSSMDGFAVRAEDTANATPDLPIRLKVVGDIPAGHTCDVIIHQGEAARIMTGACLPEGADAVVPVEDTGFQERNPGSDAPEWVAVYHSAKAGANIRPAGQDVHAGEKILPPHHKLRPQDLGMLAMLGIAQVPVFRRPRVAFFSTGDELVPVSEPLQIGQIHDSNSYVLAAIIQRYGGEPLNLGVARDYYEAVKSKLDRAAEVPADLILSSAGVSVGAFDYVRTIVEEQGKLDFWRVNMRPGKPLAFGNYRGVPFIGLPGNPVSTFVGFEVFVRPAILKLAGMKDLNYPTFQAVLAEDVKSDGRESYLRAIVSRRNDELVAQLTGHQGSGNIRSLVQANALMVVPSGVKFLPVGSKVEVLMYEQPFQG